MDFGCPQANLFQFFDHPCMQRLRLPITTAMSSARIIDKHTGWRPLRRHILLGLLGWCALFTMGCAPLAKMAFGVRAPRVENLSTANSWLARHQIDTSASFVLRAPEQHAFLQKTYVGSIPEALFFDSEGRYLPYKLPEDCNAGVDAFIAGLPQSAQYAQADASRNIWTLLECLENPPLLDPNSADYTIAFTWAIFGGKVMSGHLKPWIARAQTHPTQRIQYILINTDYQEHWGKPLGKKL